MSSGADRPKLLFIADPWETLDHPRDSSIHLAKAASLIDRARSYWCDKSDLFFDTGVMRARIAGELSGADFTPTPTLTLDLASFHSIHWRADPPVDLQTVRLWSLFSQASPDLNIVNRPEAMLSWTEKFAPLRFGDWSIPTFISDDLTLMMEFFARTSHAGKQVIAKPSADAASRGVQILPADSELAAKALSELQRQSGPWLVLQEVEPLVAELGETRVFVLHGKVAGSLHKKARRSDQLIMNLDLENDADRPQLSLCSLTDEQKTICDSLARSLRQAGIRIATIDFIGTRILEINVTSPGLIKWFDEQPGIQTGLAELYWNELFAHDH